MTGWGRRWRWTPANDPDLNIPSSALQDKGFVAKLLSFAVDWFTQFGWSDSSFVAEWDWLDSGVHRSVFR
jgi:hypothetical protein